MKSIKLFSALIFSSFAVQSQNYWHVEEINPGNGPLPNYTNMAIESPTSVWLSTDDDTTGLVHWDNGTVTHFDTSNSALQSNKILDLEFHDGKLWIATDKKINTYDGTFSIVAESAQLFRVSPSGDLWMKDDQFLYKHNGTSFSFEYTNYWPIYDFNIDASNKIWMLKDWSVVSGKPIYTYDGTILDSVSVEDITDSSHYMLSGLQMCSDQNRTYLLDRVTGIYMFDGTSWSNMTDQTNFDFERFKLINCSQSTGIWSTGSYWADLIIPSHVIHTTNDVEIMDPAGGSSDFQDTKIFGNNIYFCGTGGKLVYADMNIKSFKESETLSINNISASFKADGNHFFNSRKFSPTFEINPGDSTYAFEDLALWMAAKTNNDELSASGHIFYGTDLFSGPASESHAVYRDPIIKISKSEIDYHRAHYQDQNYVLPKNIHDWPANGLAALGEPMDMAPFHDANGNGYYDPQNGDFPIIRGDQAIFFTYNDTRMSGYFSKGEPTGIEVQCLVYGYDAPLDEALNNSVFMHYTLVNRSGKDYAEVKAGTYVSFELGNFVDNYVGCDSSQNTYYVYNGDNDDEDLTNSGVYGFGINPPAVGIHHLTHGLDHFQYFIGSSGPTGNSLSSDKDVWNYLNAIWLDDTPMTYGGSGYNPNGGSSTKYMFSGNPIDDSGWTETTAGSHKGARRGIGSFPAFSLDDGERYELDLVIGVGRSANGNNLTNIATLFENQSEVQDFFDAQNFEPGVLASNRAPVSVNEIAFERLVSLYPNPSNGSFYLVGDLDNTQIQIMDITGKIVPFSIESNANNKVQVELSSDLPQGLYIVRYQTNSGSIATKKLILTR